MESVRLLDWQAGSALLIVTSWVWPQCLDTGGEIRMESVRLLDWQAGSALLIVTSWVCVAPMS